jgi:hypothetical protein
LLLESYHYQAYSLDDRIMILEKDICYDDLENLVPSDIHELVLSYKSINNNGIKMKRLILDKMYKYIEQDIEKYKGYNPTLLSSIKTVVLKMGIIGEIDKKYNNLSNYKIRKYYDNCFSMMIYLLQTENILKYKEEIKAEK